MAFQQPKPMLSKVVSGGQTGVDQGALEAALELGISHGGWCPRGRLTESGIVPAHFELRETASPDYAVRTEKNVVDSDGTLILYRRSLSGGTDLTRRCADKHRRPVLAVDLASEFNIADVRRWLNAERIATLNIAGPRESSSPGIQDEARQFIIALLSVE